VYAGREKKELSGFESGIVFLSHEYVLKNSSCYILLKQKIVNFYNRKLLIEKYKNLIKKITNEI